MTFYQVRYNGRTVATFESLRFAQRRKEMLIAGGCEERKTEVVMIYSSGKEEVIG